MLLIAAGLVLGAAGLGAPLLEGGVSSTQLRPASHQALGLLGGHLTDGSEYPVEAIVYPTGPLAAAGILPGDYLIAVDGRSTLHMPATQACFLCHGEPGTQVTLTIFRPGLKRPFSVTITRMAVTDPALTPYQDLIRESLKPVYPR